VKLCEVLPPWLLFFQQKECFPGAFWTSLRAQCGGRLGWQVCSCSSFLFWKLLHYDNVDELNHHILHRFSGQERVFHSADSIANNEDGELLYPPEYLNSINCSDLPFTHLALKVGCPIMVLRNLNMAGGVCNGTRGIVTRIRNRVIEIQLITGDHAREKVFIPR
jgi:hypothetical protein